MSKKSKGVVVLDSKPPYGVGVCDDAKTRFKHQTLMQDYQELQQEAIVMKRKLDEAKQRKLTLVAEVRFLRRRYKFLAKRKTLNLSGDLKHVPPPNPLKRTKIMKAQNFSRKEAPLRRLSPIPELQPKKKHYIHKEAALRSVSPVIDQNHKAVLHAGKQATQHNLIPVSDINHKGRINIRKETFARNTTPVLDLNLKERTHGANDPALRNSMAAFDLNQDSNLNGKGASLPSRAPPIFDLNEISTGDEEFQINGEAVKFEEAKKNLIRGLNDDQQNELKLSICRNAGEGSSRVRKRKISWQDPVALRV